MHSGGHQSAQQADVDDEEDDAIDPAYPLVQQLLCPFIELAAKTQGQAAVHALKTVGQILSAQQPLVLVNERATWLLQLLDWLQKFLLPEEGGH